MSWLSYKTKQFFPFCYFYSKKTNNDYPKCTVILHQAGRGPFAPSLSPFAVKLETYLRMAKIPYKVIDK
jgi:hypothetical protein